MKNRIRDIPNDRWEKIRGELIDGMENGETLTELRNRVMEARGNDNKYGAERIARTETAGAYNAGHHEATMQDPLSWGSEWITTIDDRTRETHEGLDGERRQKGERFSNGLMYPGESSGEAEEVINCRCTIRAVEKEAA
jgi:SPP1 gp7 family putative phage head morphogenesis protein